MLSLSKTRDLMEPFLGHDRIISPRSKRAALNTRGRDWQRSNQQWPSHTYSTTSSKSLASTCRPGCTSTCVTLPPTGA